MKIFRASLRLPPCRGGMENHIKQLSTQQLNQGHEVTTYFNQGEKISPNDIAIFKKIKLSIIRPQFIGYMIFYFGIILQILISKSRFDILHIHGDWSSLIFIKPLRHITQTKKVILSVHDEISNRFFYKKLMQNRLKVVDMILTTGVKAKNQISLLTKKEIIIQSSGVEDIFYTTDLVLREKSNQVIVVSNLLKKKNLDLVLDIAKKTKIIEFIIAGEGPERESLKERIRNEDIFNVSLKGYLEKKELKTLYLSSFAFLHVAAKEGTPTAILEAMACGLPVVSTYAGGINKLISNLNFFHLPSEVDKFRESILLLFSDKPLAEKIGRENMREAKKYKWADVAFRISNLSKNEE